MHRSTSGLTWHDDTIPENEVWVKIGGDKGHGSFKLNIQVINVNKPNSTCNSCLLAVFKAGDSTANLHTALDQYEEQLTEIERMKSRFVTLTYSIKQNDNQYYTSRDWNIQLFFYWGLRVPLYHVWSLWSIWYDGQLY